MIDWLNIEIPHTHNPIASGRCMMIDADGVITSEFELLRNVENEFGSYSSSVRVQSICTAYTISKAEKGKDGQVTGIVIKGNPTKYLQGHNIFGISCIRSLVIGVVKDVLPKLGFSEFCVYRVVEKIKNWQFLVTKIDITKMFDLGSNQAVNDYLQMMPFTVSSRGDRCEFCKNTFYIGKHSGLWSFKFYNKYKEITSYSKKHRLPDFLPPEFLQFTEGQLRAELVLQKKALERLELTDPKLLQQQLDEVFERYSDSITMKNQHIREQDYLKLSSAYQATLSLWRQGRHLKTFYSKEKYYRHRRRLLELGIDISKPPIHTEQRLTYVKPLRVLEPKEVQVIPPSFYSYRAKELFA